MRISSGVSTTSTCSSVAILLGLFGLRCASFPIIAARQERPAPNDTSAWCNYELDWNDPANPVMVWEDWGVGNWFANWVSSAIDPPDDNWPTKLYLRAMPEEGGESGIGSCGKIAGTCKPNLDCEAMVERGYPQAYWVFKHLESFQEHLNVANEKLQTSSIIQGFEIDSMVSDFSADKTFQNVISDAVMATIFGAAFFLVGGIAGAASLAAGAAARGTQAGLAAARATARVAQKTYDDLGAAVADAGASSAAVTARVNARAALEAANARVKGLEASLAKAQSAGTHMDVLGAGSYLVGSSFYEVGAAAQQNGQVDPGKLAEAAGDFSSSSFEQLARYGRMVNGIRWEGDDYDSLPYETDSPYGPIPYEDPIAGFLVNGKFLSSVNTQGWDEAFESTYALVRQKMVDLALQMAGYQIIADLNNGDEESCLEQDHAQWRSGYCLRLFRQNEDPQPCVNTYGKRVLDGGASYECEWTAADDEIIERMEKYNVDLGEYVDVSYRCAIEGDRNDQNMTEIPLDGSKPLCWFNPVTRPAEFRVGGSSVFHAQVVDFTDWSE